MNNNISVVIRNKNQSQELNFLLKNLNSRYKNQISEIIVLDNLSTDESERITRQQKARFVSIERFSYGGSANQAAENAKNDIIVMFSAHAYPVSHDFFEQIKLKFEANPNLAGLRCLHNNNDYKNYIEEIDAEQDPNKSGLIFCGSAFNKKVWELHKFKDDIVTMEDKEWSVRVLKNGFNIEFAPSIFCYHIKRTKRELFFRYKNETVGAFQLWHQELKLLQIFKSFVGSLIKIIKNGFEDFYYALLRFGFQLSFYFNKPKKF